MLKPKVSIVVPIYNVEKYLHECVDSILNQTLKEIEVILVNDGSPDNCGKIIDEYSKKDQRVVPVHQKNGGYSVAVNRGIDLARGEYIGIIESDDWIEKDMYEKLYASAKKYHADITKGTFTLYNSYASPKDRPYISPMKTGLENAPEKSFAPEDWPAIIAGHASIWSAIYRADLIKKIHIPDSAGASYQDLPFMISITTAAKTISVVKRPFYHWRNEPSQSHSTASSGKKSLKMAENTLLALKILQKSGKYEAMKEAFFAQAIWTNSNFYFRLEKPYQAQYFAILQKIFEPIKFDKTFSEKFLRPEDKLFLKAILNNRPALLKPIYLLGALRRRLSKGLTNE